MSRTRAPNPQQEITGAALFQERELTVTLRAAGNIDRGENPFARVPGVANGSRAARTLAEAAGACRAYIEENDLGAGQWSGGAVRAADGKLVARVSYNGRVWSAREARAEAKPRASREQGPTQ